MDGFSRAAGLAAALLLGACSGSHDPLPSRIARQPRAAATPPVSTAALFQPSRGVLPYPTDLYFIGSTDGTLNIRAGNALIPGRTALNTLDGFSTTEPLRVRFSGPVDPRSFTARSLVVLQVTIDGITRAVTSVVRSLEIGTDYTAALSTGAGADDSILEIRPTQGFIPSSGTANNGYLVLLTNSVRDTAGAPVQADREYAQIKAAVPGCAAITDDSLREVCRLTAPQLRLARSVGVDPADVVLSFSFSTQSTTDSLAAVERMTGSQPLLLHDTGLTTAQVDPRLSGHATIHVGTLTIPYYLSRNAPLSGFWLGNPSPLDSSSRFLTRFNPAPVPTQTLRIPVLVTVPNANSAAGASRPLQGWPVVIFEHGLGRNRGDALAIADSFADSGLVVVAIDLPLHGIADPTSPLYAAASNPLYAGLQLPPGGSIERTFDLHIVSRPDGFSEPTAEAFINLTSPLTFRDNMRQGAADLIALTRSLPELSLDADPATDLDPQRVHFLGHSLGAMVGSLFLGVMSNTEVRTATLAMPGGAMAELLRQSPALGPETRAVIQSHGYRRGTPAFEQYLRDVQSALDCADPLNYIAAASVNRPLQMFQVIGSLTSPADQVVPNSATQRLIAAAGLSRASGGLSDPNGLRIFVNFVSGSHASLIDPTASMAVTTQMQAQAIIFTGAPVPPIPPLSFPGSPASAAGSTVLMLNPAVIQP